MTASRLDRLAIRAFPKRWRAVHEEEFLATAEELRFVGGHRRRLGDAAQTVRAGWSTRLRSRPPLRHWLAYRCLERPLAAPWHGWMNDDLAGRWLGTRFLLLIYSPLLLMMTYTATNSRPGVESWVPVSTILGMLGIAFVGGPLKSRQLRRRMRRRLDGQQQEYTDLALLPSPDPSQRLG